MTAVFEMKYDRVFIQKTYQPLTENDLVWLRHWPWSNFSVEPPELVE